MEITELSVFDNKYEFLSYIQCFAQKEEKKLCSTREQGLTIITNARCTPR